MSIEAVKAQLLAAMTCIENAYSILAQDEVKECQHPIEKRDHSASTMGNIQWTCGVCGYTEKEGGEG